MAQLTLTYKGFAPDYLTSDQLIRLFDRCWGAENRGLPGYPAVIGNISSTWKDAEGNIHHVDHLDELIKAYSDKLTAEINIKGGVGRDSPRITFVYIPFKKKAGIAVTGEERAAQALIDFIKELFPMSQVPIVFISYVTPELAYADFIKKLLEKRLGDKVKVFVAKRGISTGEHPFNTMLDQNLLNAEAIIPICTPLSRESNWLWWETSSVWTRKKHVSPLFANISPNEFGEPIKSLFQGNDFFDAEGLEKMAVDLAGYLRIDIGDPSLAQDEVIDLKRLSNFKVKNTAHSISIDRKDIQIEGSKHLYSLEFHVKNEGRQEYKDVALELTFPAIALQRHDWNYPHLSSEKVENGKYIKLMSLFSGLSEQAQSHFRKDLYSGRSLKIFGEGGMTDLRYIANDEVHSQSESLEVSWRLFIDGYLVEEGGKSLSELINF